MNTIVPSSFGVCIEFNRLREIVLTVNVNAGGAYEKQIWQEMSELFEEETKLVLITKEKNFITNLNTVFYDGRSCVVVGKTEIKTAKQMFEAKLRCRDFVIMDYQ